MSSAKISELAALCRLSAPTQDLQRLERDLQEILSSVARLEEVDVTGVAPLLHPLDFPAPTRADDPEAALDLESVRALAPHLEDDCFVVPSVRRK